MNSRERIIKTFEHEEPDRVPTFVQSMMPTFIDAVMNRYEDEIEESDILMLGKDFTPYIKIGFESSWGAHCPTVRDDPSILEHHPLPKMEGNKRIEKTGRIVETGILNGHSQSWVSGSYLKNPEQAIEWYSTYIKPNRIPLEGAVDQTNQMIHAYDHILDRFVPVCGMPSILEPLMEGLGMGLFSRMIRKHRTDLHKFFEWETRNAIEHAKIAVETDYEVFNLADDCAFKNATMINPKDHMEFVMPCYREICKIVRKAGKFIFFHSDGFTEPFFPGLIEAGFHGVESLEPNAGMNLKHLKETYGDKLCLIGNIDVSTTLPLGTPAEVAAEVKQCIQDAAEGGGYIVSPCTDLTDAVPLENALALIAAVEKYGYYN